MVFWLIPSNTVLSISFDSFFTYEQPPGSGLEVLGQDFQRAHTYLGLFQEFQISMHMYIYIYIYEHTKFGLSSSK